ncbi:MAG: M23 family metallopeptidase [Verrucomicrobiales bacterium]|nr:M23 family metallopeptidase [Verrucomicrobiales bacterium]
MSSNLDYQRHFSELFRVVLPIFVVVATIAIVLWAVFRPPPEKTDAQIQWEPRVGLLLAETGVPYDPAFSLARPIEMATAPMAARFDFPMGGEHGSLTYNAQPFLTSRHLGDDLNGIGGQDSDKGDAVYAAGDGKVIYAGWPSDGWGNVVILLHQMPSGALIETLYAHLDRVLVPTGANVVRGQKIGTVGKADGRYLAHLHFEIRENTSVSAGGGYADSALGRVAGELFLSKRRGAEKDRLNPAVEGSEAESGSDAGIRIDAK